MAMTETQAMNFLSRVKVSYTQIADHVQAIQAAALMLVQEVTAHGGVSTITSAIPDEAWDTAYPFTKQEFGAIAGDFGSLTDVLGEHSDLKTNLTKLRE